MEENKPDSKFKVPINSDILFKYLGVAQYKINLYEETMTQQMYKINSLTKDLNEVKGRLKDLEK